MTILSDLNRAKVLFQQRALLAALDITVSHAPSCEGAGARDGQCVCIGRKRIVTGARISPVNQVSNHFHNLE